MRSWRSHLSLAKPTITTRDKDTKIPSMASLTLTSCNMGHTTSVDVSKVSSKSSNSPNSSVSSKSSGTPVMSTDNEIITSDNYLVNDQIPIGKNVSVIAKQGTFNQNGSAFKGTSYYNKDVDFLGMDSNYNFIIDDYISGKIDSVNSNNKVTTVLNYIGSRKDHMFAMSMCGNIVAWSECPHGDMDPAADTTNGAGWGLYYTDLKAKKIIKIDGYKKITVPANAQYHYLAPNKVIVSPDHISYISWDYAPDGSVEPVVKLYTISTQKLEILDYLNEDVTNHAFGYPYVSGDNMVWCKAQINQDGTYSGYSVLYNLKTKVISKLVTDENIINPQIRGDYIFASGQPNKTFYDSEICIYDILKNKWMFKINSSYSQYKNLSDNYLTDLQSVGNYLVWDTGGSNSLVLFNKNDNKLYNIVPASDKRYITGPELLDGNILIWYDRPYSSQGTGIGAYKYVVLK